MEQFAAYGHAIASLALFALIGLILNPLSAAKKAKDGVPSGALPEPDYSDPSYRWSRAYLNATEVCGLFTAVTVAAILAGASPFWVNLLASLFVVSRIIVAIVHIRGIGQANNGPRTMIFAFGFFCCVLLGLLAIGAIFT